VIASMSLSSFKSAIMSSIILPTTHLFSIVAIFRNDS
jgi:hypothetical protein